MDHGNTFESWMISPRSFVSIARHSKTSLSTAGREAGIGFRRRRAATEDSGPVSDRLVAEDRLVFASLLAPAAARPGGRLGPPGAPGGCGAKRGGGGLGAAGGCGANRAEARGGASRSSDEPFAAGSR